MNLVKVEKTEKDFIDLIYKSYSETFPEDERREKENFLKLFEKENVSVYFIEKDREKIGYLVAWQLGFLFVEHFEIFKNFRNQGWGGDVLKLLIEKYDFVVLESEPDFLDEKAKSRIEFYKRNGFSIIDEKYIQPAYAVDKKSLNLFLLSNQLNFNLKEVERKIKENVYSVKN